MPFEIILCTVRETLYDVLLLGGADAKNLRNDTNIFKMQSKHFNIKTTNLQNLLFFYYRETDD